MHLVYKVFKTDKAFVSGMYLVYLGWHPIYIRAASPLFPLGVRDASASSAMHPLFPLFVHFAIIPGNPFGAAIHFHPLSSARLPMNVRLTSLLHTTHVRSFPYCFRQFCPFLERMKTDGATSEILLVRCVLYAYVLRPSASGTGL